MFVRSCTRFPFLISITIHAEFTPPRSAARCLEAQPQVAEPKKARTNATTRFDRCQAGVSTLQLATLEHNKLSVQFSNFLPIIIGVIVLLLLALLAKKFASGKRDPIEWPFYAKKPLTQPEQVLYWRLLKALPDHVVLAQVQCSRVLGVKRGFNFYQWNNRINRLSYDFVICKKDGTVVAAIELDDKTHESATRAEQDGRKQRATEAAGVLLVRWNVAKMPDEVAIKGVVQIRLRGMGMVASPDFDV